MRSNYQIIIEYDGTDYNGWQYQKNGSSIQNEIEKALKKVLKKKIRIIGSGRTDAGVHAVGQSANFYCDKIENMKKFLNSLNYFLIKKNISINSLKKKKLNFHSRFDAKKRTYKYTIVNRKNFLVLDKNRAWLVKKKLDIHCMKKAVKLFAGTHNFDAFRSSSCGAKSPVRTIEKSSLTKRGDKIIMIFSSKSFLQHQVRSMVGCLKAIGEGKWHIDNLKRLLKSKKRSHCAPPAPSSGLYLHKVTY
ncbi:MAG: tRNA pseudouridine(38-40) synthase TruA [Candidatus Pelagibacter sp.]|nr:tRNA pseudouridine(38-40) synthase TruA [Candidatus Pelagibacter sp.]OUW67915.1 MAG: tRNA pseudouridine(38-40) synthase TruA [Candidatus Pelagibacter sp. TMED202]